MEDYLRTHDGKHVWYALDGEGSAVLLASGGPGCCDYLEPVAKLLSDEARVVRFEQRGCGRSDTDTVYDLDTCLADLEELRKHLEIERWIVGGHSWGADLALLYTLHYPQRVTALIGIAGGRVHNDREWHRIYSEKRDTVGEVQPQYLHPPNMEVNRALNDAMKQYCHQPDLLRRISRLPMPALLIGASDDIRPSWPTEQLAALIPDARYVTIEGAAHAIWLTHAGELGDVMRAFIDEIDDG